MRLCEADGKDRTSKKRKELKRIEIDRLHAADFRKRKKIRDGLPKRITTVRERSTELVKSAKASAGPFEPLAKAGGFSFNSVQN